MRQGQTGNTNHKGDTMIKRYEIGDDSGWNEIIEAESMDEAKETAEDICRDGEWGDDGASVSMYISELDDDGDEVDSDSITVEIEPNHDRLITEAVGRWDLDNICGSDPDDHDWTSEGEGGLDENPGVWSTGGTSMVFKSHCRKCGLHRTECHTGSQRNPGEHDTTEYRMLDDDEIERHIENGTMDARETSQE